MIKPLNFITPQLYLSVSTPYETQVYSDGALSWRIDDNV